MTVLVKVMLKPGVLDPQGKAIADALHRLGYGAVSDVRAGKVFRIEVDADDPKAARGPGQARRGSRWSSFRAAIATRTRPSPPGTCSGRT